MCFPVTLPKGMRSGSDLLSLSGSPEATCPGEIGRGEGKSREGGASESSQKARGQKHHLGLREQCDQDASCGLRDLELKVAEDGGGLQKRGASPSDRSPQAGGGRRGAGEGGAAQGLGRRGYAGAWAGAYKQRPALPPRWAKGLSVGSVQGEAPERRSYPLPLPPRSSTLRRQPPLLPHPPPSGHLPRSQRFLTRSHRSLPCSLSELLKRRWAWMSSLQNGDSSGT